MKFLATLIIYLCVAAPFLDKSLADTPAIPGTIERTTKQQILASLPPNPPQPSVPFLTSPSGKFTAYLVRAPSLPEAGGFGNDFCFIQILDNNEQSMWESQCGPVSTLNTCSVVFDDVGLQVFDGSTPVWDTGAQSADNNFIESVELVDQGDMRIRDKDGELAWKATDDVRANQHCGMPGSPGLSPALPPFAQPIGEDRNLHFGQPDQKQMPQASAVPETSYGQQSQPDQHPLNGVSQSFGFNSEPLINNSPYDSGCNAEAVNFFGVGVGVALLSAWFVAF